MKFEKNNKLKNRIRDKRKYLMKHLEEPDNARDLVFFKKTEEKTIINGIVTLLNFQMSKNKRFVSQAKCIIEKTIKNINVHLYTFDKNEYIQSFISDIKEIKEGTILGYEIALNKTDIIFRAKLTKIESVEVIKSKKEEKRIDFQCKPKRFFLGKKACGFYDKFFIGNIKTPVCKGSFRCYEYSFSQETRASLKKDLYKNISDYENVYCYDTCEFYEYDWDPEDAWIEDNREYLEWKEQEEKKENDIIYLDSDDLDNIDI